MISLRHSLSRQRPRGFTIIEVMISMVILSIGFLGMTALQAGAIQSNSISKQMTEATALLQTTLETYKLDGQRWNNATFTAVGGAATGATSLQALITGTPNWLLPNFMGLNTGARVNSSMSSTGTNAVFCIHASGSYVPNTSNEAIQVTARVVWFRNERNANQINNCSDIGTITTLANNLTMREVSATTFVHMN